MRLEFPGSSNVRAAELLEGGVLEVTFVGGAVYRYGNVHAAQVRAWGAAPSAGSWFHRQIKSRPKDHPLVGKGPRDTPTIDGDSQHPRVAAQHDPRVIEHAETPAVDQPVKSDSFRKEPSSASTEDALPQKICAHFLCPGPDGRCAYDEHGRLRPHPRVVLERAERARAAGLLSHEDIAALPEGTAVEVIWGGGNGPCEYTVHRIEGMSVCVVMHPPSREQELEELGRWQRGEPVVHGSVRVMLGERDLDHPGGPPSLMDIWVKLPDRPWPHREDGHYCPACAEPGTHGRVPCRQRIRAIEPLLQNWAAREARDLSVIEQAALVRGNTLARPGVTPSGLAVAAHTADATSVPVRSGGPEGPLPQWLPGNGPGILASAGPVPLLPGSAGASRIELVERGPVVVPTPQLVQPRLESMSDEELLAMVAGGDDGKAIAELLRQADGEACLRSLDTFYETFWPELEPNGRPYVKNMATDAVLLHLQAVGDGQISLLGIACSPGIGKSSAASVAFPAWMWARDPSWRAICASHAFDLARTIGLKFLSLVTSDKYRYLFPHVRLASDAVKSLTTEASGVRYAVGVDGALTGLRANLGLIDDSLNANDAGKKDAVRKANDWYDNAFNSRFDDTPRHKSAIVVIQQRLDPDDLIEHIRRLGAEILELPARYEVGRKCVTSIWEDPRTTEGELLAPEIHSQEYLDNKLLALRPHGFATQYQQRPTAREGNQFKIGMWNWATWQGDGTPSASRPKGARMSPAHVLRRRKDGSLELDYLCVSCDPTGGSLSEDASNFGIAIIGGLANMTFVLRDLTPGPRTFNQQVRDMANGVILAAKLAGNQPRFTCLVEKKALGVGSMEKIESAIKYGKFMNEDGTDGVKLVYPDGSPIVCSVKPYEPSGKGSKEQRADHLEPDMDAGLIYVMEDEEWVVKPLGWIDEFGAFPRGKDDRVDVLAQCVDHHRQLPAPPTLNQWMNAINHLAGIRRS